MIKLVVLETETTKEKLFVEFVCRGRHANIPYYFSVQDYDWAQGIVRFTRLDCAPAPIFKVGIAGNQLVVSDKYRAEVEGWLRDWGMRFRIKKERDFPTPQSARTFLKALRQKSKKSIRENRQRAGIRVRKAIRDFHKRTDEDLLAMCSY